MITPVNGSTVSMISATASMRGLLIANITIAAASSSKNHRELDAHEVALRVRVQSQR